MRLPTTNLKPGSAAEERALLNGRASVLFALSQYYLFLPFAALCMAATIAHRPGGLWLTTAPFVLQIVATIYGNRLKKKFDARHPDDDPRIWLDRYTTLSGVVGAIWGFGAIVWFVPNAFPAQAYLCLAFLGMTATEFIVRAAYRPAYLAHASFSLGPLAGMLVMDGSSYAMLTSILVLFFGGVLYSYCDAIGRMIDDSVRLRHDNALLVVRLQHEKHEAEVARDAARASERAKSAFFATMSHELRTPLNAMLGMSQLLERSKLDNSQREYVTVLLDAGRGLTTLLDDVLDLARRDEQMPTVPKEGCNAAQAMRTVARLLQPNAWQKRLQLSLKVAPALPRVASDPRQLRRVLLKLCSNAIKFTDKGGIEIAAEPVAGADGRALVRFEVTDTGPGVQEEVLPALFDPFARTDETYARKHNGAGVGLAVAKRIVNSLGGEIGFESKAGVGAKFWFTVPISAQVAGEELPEEISAPPSGLMLIGYVPDLTTRTSLERLLTPFGNRISFKSTVADAVASAESGTYSLMIVAGDGIEALLQAPQFTIPILALVPRDVRAPQNADSVLRWPSAAGALYAAIETATANSELDRNDLASEAWPPDSAIDANAFAILERSVGLKTLVDILQAYLATAEGLAASLAGASEAQDWNQAGRVARDIAGAAGGLGLAALTASARALAQASREGKGSLYVAAQHVLTEHHRAKEALTRLYPDLAA
ncbi:MAG: sensor histidine kinase [Alphaproteobacteria bacterium]